MNRFSLCLDVKNELRLSQEHAAVVILYKILAGAIPLLGRRSGTCISPRRLATIESIEIEHDLHLSSGVAIARRELRSSLGRYLATKRDGVPAPGAMHDRISVWGLGTRVRFGKYSVLHYRADGISRPKSS